MTSLLKYLETFLDFAIPVTIILISIGFALPVPGSSFDDIFFWYDIPQFSKVYSFESKVFLIGPLLLYLVALFAKNGRLLAEATETPLARMFAFAGCQICVFVILAFFFSARLDVFSFCLFGYAAYVSGLYSKDQKAESPGSLGFRRFLMQNRTVGFNGFLLCLAILIPIAGGVSSDVSRYPQKWSYDRISELIKAQEGIRSSQNECFRDDVRVATNVLFSIVYVGQQFDDACSIQQLLSTFAKSDTPLLGRGAVLKEDLAVGDTVLPSGVEANEVDTALILMLLSKVSGYEDTTRSVQDFIDSSKAKEMICQKYLNGTEFCLVRKQ